MSIEEQNKEVTQLIFEAERIDQQGAVAWANVARAERELQDALPDGLERDIARRGAHTASLKSDERVSYRRSSVVRPWVSELQWMCQSVLLCALRGCDTAPKHDPSKAITRALRHCLLFNAKNDGSFMDVEPPADLPDMERYPQHWLSHAMHAAQIVGYCHPDAETRVKWNRLYVEFCRAWHVNPESKDEMLGRLKGDNG